MPIESPDMTFYSTTIVTFSPICHHLRDIRNRNVHDLDLTAGPRSNVNMPNRNAKRNFRFNGDSDVCSISHHLRDRSKSVEMQDIDLENESQCQEIEELGFVQFYW